MADPILFPGTEMTVIEKYPDSRRLDHPNFGDVYKTTFAKGVITDFRRPEHVPPEDRIAAGQGFGEYGHYIDLPGDPFLVESMAKVTGEDWGESEYIPIFYQPKKDFWDEATADPPILATDFDEENGCFKQAWMSFRCGDEVVVMLQEGVPVAVLGHADGVPRIGEDIFAMCFEGEEPLTWVTDISGTHWVTPEDGPFTPNPYYISATKAQKTVATWNWRTSNAEFEGDWTIADKGPDGFDYGLLQECEMAESPEEVQSGLYTGVLDPLWQIFSGTPPWEPPPELPWPTGIIHVLAKSNHYFCKVCVWIVIVGPIVYAIYGASYDYESQTTYYLVHTERDGSAEGNVPVTIGPFVPVIESPYNNTIEAFDQWCVCAGGWGEAEWITWWNYWERDVDYFGNPTGPPTWPYELDPDAPTPVTDRRDVFNTQYFMVKAGLYTPELVEKIKASVSNGSPAFANGFSADGVHAWDWGSGTDDGYDMWPEAPEELVLQRGLTWFLNYDYRSFMPDFWISYYYDAPTQIKFKTHPHTKEEMQAAGVWPKAAEG